MRSKRQTHRTAAGPETLRVLAFALSGVAKKLARLLRRHLGRRRRTLTRRGEPGLSKCDVFRLLCKAFSRAILTPRGDVARAAKQRSALVFALAAADLPSTLNLSGLPKELRRIRKRGRR
jgi:hypothetical protein